MSARRIALPMVFLAAVVSLASCGPSEPIDRAPGGVDSTDSPAVAPPVSEVFDTFPAAGVPEWRFTRKRGIGIVFLDRETPVAPPFDTLLAHVRPSLDAQPIARLYVDDTGVFHFEAARGALAKPGALEAAYEDVGLPLLERRADGWMRVMLGEDNTGTVVSGWVATKARTRVVLWEERFADTPLFFSLAPDSAQRFHASPEGPVESFPLPAGEPGDYILWPLETRGDWMRVRAVTPSDYCFDPRAPRVDTLWIKWREASGEPRVWFFTRGC